MTLRALPLVLDELKTLADAWQGIVKGMTTAVVGEQLAIIDAEAQGQSVSRDRLIELTTLRDAVFGKFYSVVTSYAAKGGDEADVSKYRAYRSAIFVEEKQVADWRTLASRR